QPAPRQRRARHRRAPERHPAAQGCRSAGAVTQPRETATEQGGSAASVLDPQPAERGRDEGGSAPSVLDLPYQPRTARRSSAGISESSSPCIGSPRPAPPSGRISWVSPRGGGVPSAPAP